MISITNGQRVVWLQFLKSDCLFLLLCLSGLRICKRRTLYSGAQKTRERFICMKWTAKNPVWYVGHANGVLGFYYFKKETVKGVDYYQVQDIYVWSDPPQFPRNAAFQQDEALPHITRAPSVRFWIICFRIHDWEIPCSTMASQITRLNPTGRFPSGICTRSSLSGFCTNMKLLYFQLLKPIEGSVQY